MNAQIFNDLLFFGSGAGKNLAFNRFTRGYPDIAICPRTPYNAQPKGSRKRRYS